MTSFFTEKQIEEIDRAARRHPDAHVRSRAMAVRAVALGHSRKAVAKMLPFSAYSVGQWVRDFSREGVEAFSIAEGRGRRSNVDEEQVRSRLRQSPRKYGIDQTRWTLRALGQACPSLSAMSERGILSVLHRLGFRYKHGQPWIHSPDPLYTEKKTLSKRPIRRRKRTERK